MARGLPRGLERSLPGRRGEGRPGTAASRGASSGAGPEYRHLRYQRRAALLSVPAPGRGLHRPRPARAGAAGPRSLGEMGTRARGGAAEAHGAARGRRGRAASASSTRDADACAPHDEHDAGSFPQRRPRASRHRRLRAPGDDRPSPSPAARDPACARHSAPPCDAILASRSRAGHGNARGRVPACGRRRLHRRRARGVDRPGVGPARQDGIGEGPASRAGRASRPWRSRPGHRRPGRRSRVLHRRARNRGLDSFRLRPLEPRPRGDGPGARGCPRLDGLAPGAGEAPPALGPYTARGRDRRARSFDSRKAEPGRAARRARAGVVRRTSGCSRCSGGEEWPPSTRPSVGTSSRP